MQTTTDETAQAVTPGRRVSRTAALRKPLTRLPTLLLLLILVLGGCDTQRAIVYTDEDRERLEVVRTFADNALEAGADRWSGRETPLLADGIDLETGEPVRWRFEGESYIISNLASQQNFFRVLDGLSSLIGEERYRRAAEEAVRYHFDHLASGCGLLRWGGHQFIDLETLEPVGRFDADAHEFKNNFPYYELMHRVDSGATANFLRAFWNAHILDWEQLDMNRHGAYGLQRGALWDHPFADPEPFFEGTGLTFINAGSDLIQAAGMLHALQGEEEALEWAHRLAEMYVKARHPDTGLGAYQYSMPLQREEPVVPMTETRHTWSTYGDRARNQFAQEFGEVAREGWVVWGGRIRTIYVSNAYMQLALAESLEEEGGRFLRWTVDGLLALARHSYDPQSNRFRPMWADGTELTGERMARFGYYGSQGTRWNPLPADSGFLKTYARAYRLSGDPELWETARSIARGTGMGEIGVRPGEQVLLDLESVGEPEPEEIFALIELYRAAPHPDYLQRARLVAGRLIEERFHEGFFLPSDSHRNASFDRLEPLALLSLDALLRGRAGDVPAHVGGSGYIHGRFDGIGRTYDREAIWSVTRP